MERKKIDNLELETIKTKIGTLKINRNILIGYTGTFCLSTLIHTTILISEPNILNTSITGLNLLMTGASGYKLYKNQQELTTLQNNYQIYKKNLL